MSDPQDYDDDRPTIEGTDPDLGISTSSEDEDNEEDNAEPSADDPVEVEDLP